MYRLLALLSAASALSALTAGATETKADAALIARGRYLVADVAGCGDCHSPRDQQGQFIPSLLLKGAPLGFAPTVPMPAWAAVAPAIAGLPTLTTEQGVQFLMTGLRPDGSMPRPPMPQFRLSREDAEAVVAYLKSLP